MTGTVVLCGVLIVVGLFGIVVPVLPGTILVGLGIGIWASEDGSAEAWTVFGVAAGLLLAGTVIKYAVPGRRLKAVVPTRTLVIGGVGAVVGLFVIPLVGVLVGFPVGVYLAERVRVGADAAWPSTKAALRAAGLSILIELLAALAATAVWVGGVGIT
jgi:uncharacterized protein YqgC (DUF456 family)